MQNPILIVGGYGVVGLQLAALIRKQNPDLPLLLAGRSQAAADKAAAEIGYASGVVLDVTASDPLASVKSPLSAIVGAVNDPDDKLLTSAIAQAIPYVDITRWTERLLKADALAKSLQPKSSVTLASTWMAGVSAIVARRACDGLGDIESINTTILFRLKDKAGPNSVEYADRMSTPFRVWKQGRWQQTKPVTDAISMTFPSGDVAKAFRFDEPSQETLVDVTGARSISSRIGYDDAAATRGLVFMVRSGLWRLISGSAFTKLRHSLIYNPGEGASHEIIIDAVGRNGQHRATIVDPAGQTHLTAVGAYVQLCETIGLEGREARPPGVHFPEHATDFEFARRVMEREGISIEV